MTRALFLIVVGGAVLKLLWWQVFVVAILYLICEELDRRIAQRKRDKALNYELYGWEPDKDHQGYETKGELTRIQLTGTDQIIVTRVANLLWDL
jgi:hypothetical protein